MARSKVISVRLGPVEAEIIRTAADNEDVPLSEFIRNAAFGRAILHHARNGDGHNPVELGRQLAAILERTHVDSDTLEQLLEDCLGRRTRVSD